MNTKPHYRVHLGCLMTFILALFITGCGGGNPPSSGGGEEIPASIINLKADAGNIIGIRVGETAFLNGNASTAPSSQTKTYAWSFTHKPQASKTADLVNPNTVNPSFVPDVIGTYMVQLVVTSGGITSQRAIALVEATVSGNLTGDARVHTSFSSQCSTCHDGRFLDPNVNPGLIAPKSGSHVGASNVCEACHTTFGFNLIRYVDHNEVFGSCSTCHDGVIAIGKSPGHITTTSECDVCHSTNSFLELDLNGNYDHTGIISGCATCHNGKTAIGKTHIQPESFEKANNDCGFCHSTDTFTGAFPDHSVILDAGTRCDTCHGVDAIGTSNGHPEITDTSPLITNTVDCGVCHSIRQFSLAGVFGHRVDAAVVPCEVCHTEPNSINAIGTASYPVNLNTGVHGDTNGNDCGVCHGTSVVRSFQNAAIDHTDATVLAQRCDACHDGAGTALQKSANHILTNTILMPATDCDACHTSGNFATGTFDHSADNMIGLACSGCHNGTKTAGKTVNHIDTALECDSCHTADLITPKSVFQGAVFHANVAVTNNCASCHDGIKSSGKSVGHMATVFDTPQNQDQDCSDCHIVKFDNFTGGSFDHTTGVNNNCGSCHDGFTAKGRAIAKKLDHIPAINECSQCHDDTTVTGGFMTWNLFVNPNEHMKFLNGCEGCHTAKYLSARTNLLKAGSVNHVPTSQDCHFCHSNTNFADNTQFTHDGITGNCESCHDGNFFTTANAQGIAQDPTPPHPTTTADCGLCHGIGNNFTDGIFDHTGIVDNCSACHGDNAPLPDITNDTAVTRKTSFPSHVITTQDCNICHVPGTFKTAVFNHSQINTGCVDCHLNPGATATAKPTLAQGHVDTPKDCFECHNTTSFAGAKYDHTDIVANCASCHDGVVALGKDGLHVPTNDDCSACHQTTGMIPATFDHLGIIANCVTCHDGTLATGKTVGHVATELDCGSCHSIPSGSFVANGPTNDWIPASFNHSGITNNTRCDSCHGVTAKPKTPEHWLTGFDCRDCHTTITFVGATWKHDASATGNCDSCHNNTNPAPNGGARAKSIGHITTSVQCDGCHTTTAWAPTNFTHDQNNSNQDDYPGDHRRATNCINCHGNSIDSPFVYRSPPPLAPFCAGCHERDFVPKDKHIGGEGGTILQNRNCAESGCHRVNDGGF